MKTMRLPIDYNTLSHELRTPLVGILGMTELLHSEKLSPAQRNQVDIIQQSGDRLLHFINEILSHKKIRIKITY